MDPELAKIRRERYLAQKRKDDDGGEASDAREAAASTSTATATHSVMTSKPKAASKPKHTNDDVITLLDDSDSEDEVKVLGHTNANNNKAKAARKSSSTSTTTHNNNINNFVPFHLYTTTTSQSQIHTNDTTQKYFRTLRQLIGLDSTTGNGSGMQGKKRPKRKYQWLIVFNFLIDFDYLLEKLLPDITSFHRVIVFYGTCGNNMQASMVMNRWKQLLVGTNNTVEFIPLIPSDPPRSRTNPLSMKIPYGVHHTKMFLMGYEDEMTGESKIRVVIHTANLHAGDCEYKTQGAYTQDFPLKQQQTKDDTKKTNVFNPYKKQKCEEDDNPFGDEEDVPFEEDLITYLESYRYLTRLTWCSTSNSMVSSNNSLSNKPMTWLQLIRQYDYSTAYVVLIPSVPGRHKDDEYHNFGYLKLRKAIVDWVCSTKDKDGKVSAVSPRPLLCQFSSIGSLNEKWVRHFLSTIDFTSTQDVDPIASSDAKGKGGGGGKGSSKEIQPPLSSKMKIIWPTVEEIRTSVEGYNGGASVPGKVANLSKEFLQPLFHRWSKRLTYTKSNAGRDPFKTVRHVPHIKTFIQPSNDANNGIEWLVLTSHNLSIAAWGQLQKRSEQSRTSEKILFIRHWELGVFISPATLVSNAAAPGTGNDIRILPYPGIATSGGDKNGVINLDSDNDEEATETPPVLVPLPFDLNPDKYDTNHDIPWATDRSCTEPDIFGCIMR